ncbi:MAG: hypothetical protein U0P45_12990 [Acidimicrobiales bacterium]
MSRFRTPALGWLAVTAVLAVEQRVVNARHTHQGAGGWPGFTGFFAGWQQFDVGVYQYIAANGYWWRPGERPPTTFFPLFALLIRWLQPLTGDDLFAAGLIVSAASGLAAVVLFWRWTGRWDLAPDRRRLALWLLLLYPWAFFLTGVPFSDALFVALLIGAYLAVESDRLLLAALVGALASATRPTGMFLAPALVLLALERAEVLTARPLGDQPSWFARLRLPLRFDRRRFRWRQLWPIGSLAGIAAYSAYLGVRFGRPFTYLADRHLYDGTGPKTWFKAGLIENLITWDDPWRTVAQALAAVLAVAVFLAVPAVGRRFGWGYGLFTFTVVAMPALSTRDFNSTGRYLLAAFPVLVLLAEALGARGRRWQVAWLVASAVGLLAFNAAFAQSQMVS